MTGSDPLAQLQDIAKQGHSSDSFTPEQTIIYGNRMKNKFVRRIVKQYQDEGGLDNAALIELVLTMDQLIEDGTLTEDLLKKIEENPELLTNGIQK